MSNSLVRRVETICAKIEIAERIATLEENEDVKNELMDAKKYAIRALERAINSKRP